MIKSAVVATMKALGLRDFVETGTYHGDTSAFMATLGFDAHTCEIDPDRLARARERHGHIPNWHPHLGNSSA